MQIISGSVRFEDGIKTTQGDQYSPTRKVAVELNFSLDASEAGDPAIQTVLDKAQAFVNGKLGLKTATAAAVSTGTGTVRAQDNAAAQVVPIAVGVNGGPANMPMPKRAPGRPPSTGKDALAKAAGVDTKIVGKNEDALELSSLSTAAGTPPSQNSPKPADDISDLMGTPAKEVTDADLNDAAQKTMQRANSQENPAGPRIRKLVGEYLPEGVQPVMANVPQAKRAELLAKMKELK